ncbi:unnamed protein product [Ectocarpus sp. 12 AP-2014]
MAWNNRCIWYGIGACFTKHGTVLEIQRLTRYIAPKKSWHLHNSTPTARHARVFNANQRKPSIHHYHQLRTTCATTPLDHATTRAVRDACLCTCNRHPFFSKTTCFQRETPGSARSVSIRIHTNSGRQRSPTINEKIVTVQPPHITQPKQGA